MRRYANFAFGVAGVLLILTTWLAPSVLGWWFQPPIPVPISCNEAVTWGVNRLVQSQLVSLGLGAVGGCVLAFFTRKKAALAVAPAPGVAPAAAAPAAAPAPEKKQG
jgi:hypothetical protein